MTENKEPLATVIVANRNGLNFLKECLLRLESQTWENLEVIVIDDASSDGSVEFLKNYRGIRKFFSIFLKENRGLPHVRNLGYRCSQDQFVVPKVAGTYRNTAISGNTVLVGLRFDDTEIPESGSVYVFGINTVE